MKLIVILCFIAVVAATPTTRDTFYKNQVELQRYENKPFENGKYSFLYLLSDGQRREEQGEVKNVGLENESLVVKGSYTWFAPDGKTYEISYVADKEGYRIVSNTVSEEIVLDYSVDPRVVLSLLG